MSSMKLCHTYCLLLVLVLPGTSMAAGAAKSKNDPAMKPVGEVAINQKADGYRGIWYMNQPVDNEYAFKYSGGFVSNFPRHSSLQK